MRKYLAGAMLLGLCSTAAANPSAPACISREASTFWDRARALCSALASASPEESEITSFCRAGTAPEFAALPEAERQAVLDRIAAQSGISLSFIGPAASGSSEPAAFAAGLAQRLRGPELQLTPAEAELVRQFASATCSQPGAARLLPLTCSAPDTADASELLASLRQDLFGLVVASEESTAESRLAGAVLVAAVNGADLWSLAAALENPALSGTGSACPSVAPAAAGTPPELVNAGRLLREILRDGVRLDLDAEHYVRISQRVLGRPLLPAQKAALEELLQVLRQTGDRAPAGTTSEFLLRLTRAATLAWTVTNDQPAPSLDLLAPLLLALTSADYVAIVDQLVAYRLAAEPNTTSAETIRAVAVVARARSGEDLREAIERALLPPWLGGLVLDARAEIPILDAEDFHIDLSGKAGWEADSWGFSVGGHNLTYVRALSGRDLVEQQVNAAAQGWLNYPDLQSDAGISLGGSFAYDEYLTRLFFLDNVATINDDHSTFLRLGLLVGAFARPAPEWFLRLQGNVAYHFESYTGQLIVPRGPDQGTTEETADGSSADYRVRALSTWRFAPNLLRATAVVQATVFQLTRSSNMVIFDPQEDVDVQNLVQRTRRVEFESRLHLDVEALEIGGWVRPGAVVALQYFDTSNGTTSTSALVPVVGAGIFSHLP